LDTGAPTTFSTNTSSRVVITTHRSGHPPTTSYSTTYGPTTFTTTESTGYPTTYYDYTDTGAPYYTTDTTFGEPTTYFLYTNYSTGTYYYDYTNTGAPYYTTSINTGYPTTYSGTIYGTGTTYSTNSGGPTTTSYRTSQGSPGGSALLSTGTPPVTTSHCTIPVTLSLPPTGSGTTGSTGTVSGTTNYPPGVSFSSGSPGVCTVNSSTGVVTFLQAGTCVITETVTGSGNYTGTVSQTQKITVGSNKPRLFLICHFKINSYALNSACKSALTAFANTVNSKNLTSIIIQGWASISGNPSINNPLSIHRADAVRDYLQGLLSNLNVSVSISAQGYGATGPKQTEAYIYGEG
jgi:hypothetical protein